MVHNMELEAQIEQQGQALVGEIATKLPNASWLRDGNNAYLAPIRPALRDSSDDVRAVWHRAASIAVDCIHNSGWLAGAVKQASVDTVGNGLTLNAQPDAEALGWDEDYRIEWCRTVEKRFARYANDPYECDLRGRCTLGQMQSGLISWGFGFGEGVAILTNKNRAHCENRLKVMMVSPHRLVMETNEQKRIVQGVHLNADGMAVGYRFARKGKYGHEQNIDVPARNRHGQQQVVHVFEGDPTQIRGITPLAPILKVLKQSEQLADATLTTTMLQTILAATITSHEFSDEVYDMFNKTDKKNPLGALTGFMNAKMSWAENAKIDIGKHGNVVRLFPGEKLEMNGAVSPSDNYLEFSKNLLREIARCLGQTYESLTLDHSSATYSSVRMGNSTIWPIVIDRRNKIVIPFMQAVYKRWLEEQIITGRIDFKGGFAAFDRNRAAACAAQWHGPKMPTADDFKTARAQTERLNNGTSSLTQECAENGTDIETVISQRAQEHAMFKAKGLPSPYDIPVVDNVAQALEDEQLEAV